MTRRVVWAVVLLVFFTVMPAVWFISTHDQVTVKVRERPGPEARKNAYLALERFLVRMGRPAARQNDARLFDTLPPGGVVLLDGHRRAHVTPARVDRIMGWVERGGYLIVAPDLSGSHDLLLERFDVKRYERPKTESEDSCECDQRPTDPDAKASKDDAPRAAPRKKPVPPKQVVARVPGGERGLLIAFRYPGLTAKSVAPAWSAEVPEFGAQVLHFTHGTGNVTIVSGLFGRLTNGSIGNDDHAEFLWSLIGKYQPHSSAPITIVTRLTLPSLWEWLAESAPAALSALAVLIILWLWRVVPRFGPPAPDPEPERRQLREHLAAIGHYVWRAGGMAHWLAVARESFQARLSMRHPALAALPPQEQALALAELTHRPAALIASALHGPAETAPAFTSAVRTLRNLERLL